MSLGEKISVCLLTFNHANVIRSTLESVLLQSIDGYEVVVSDDCSTDGTWEIILEFSRRDSRIVPIRTPRNLGMAGNANFVFKQVSRQYVALLHHDDLYRNDLLEKWAAVMQQYPDVAFVFNPYSVSGSDFVYEEALPGGHIDGHEFLDKYLLPRWGCPVRGTAMIRRAAWASVGGMREEFALLADVDLWMRLSMSWGVGYVPEPLIAVRAERPIYYPDIYKGEVWDWTRQRILYEIHASNRLNYLNSRTLLGKLQWFFFRARLSAETLKWLGYAVLKGKPAIIRSAADAQTKHDMFFLVAVRNVLQRVYG